MKHHVVHNVARRADGRRAGAGGIDPLLELATRKEHASEIISSPFLRPSQVSLASTTYVLTAAAAVLHVTDTRTRYCLISLTLVHRVGSLSIYARR